MKRFSDLFEGVHVSVHVEDRHDVDVHGVQGVGDDVIRPSSAWQQITFLITVSQQSCWKVMLTIVWQSVCLFTLEFRYPRCIGHKDPLLDIFKLLNLGLTVQGSPDSSPGPWTCVTVQPLSGCSRWDLILWTVSHWTYIKPLSHTMMNCQLLPYPFRNRENTVWLRAQPCFPPIYPGHCQRAVQNTSYTPHAQSPTISWL